MESKDKLKRITKLLFDDILYRLDNDEHFRNKSCLMKRNNDEIYEYVKANYGIDIIEKDLDIVDYINDAYQLYKNSNHTGRDKELFIETIFSILNNKK